MEEKRNIGAMKNTQRNGRKKRDTTTYDDFPDESELVDTQEVYENTPYNYNDLSFVTNELYPNYGISDISNEKRFLGEYEILFILSEFEHHFCGPHLIDVYSYIHFFFFSEYVNIFFPFSLLLFKTIN